MAVAGVCLGASFGIAHADNPPKKVGDLAIVDGSARTIARGDGLTEFIPQLPEGSTCPGDSANDQWRIQGFFIPVDDDPLKVEFGPAGPRPVNQGQYPLYYSDTSLVVNQFLLRNPGPGEPGRIPAFPKFSFAGLVGGYPFAGGRYRAVIACTKRGVIDKYWDVVIDTAPAGDGKPRELEWQLVNVPTATALTDSSSDSSIALPLMAAGGVVVVGLVLWQRRNRRPTQASKEIR